MHIYIYIYIHMYREKERQGLPLLARKLAHDGPLMATRNPTLAPTEIHF